MQDKELDFSWLDLIRAYSQLTGKRWKKYILYIVPLFLISFYSVIPPLFLARIIDFFGSYQPGESLSTFYFYALFLGTSFSLVAYIRLSLKKALGNIRTNIIYDINVKGFDRLLSLSWIESRGEVAGAKTQKLQNGTQAFVTLSEQINNELFQAVTATIGITIIFSYLNSQYLLFLFFYLAGFFGIIKFYYARIQQVKNDYNKASEKSGGSYIEGLSNILTIKTLGAKESFNDRIAEKENIKKKFEYLGRRYGIGQWIAFQVFNGICIAGYLLLVGHDYVTGAITLGSIVIFYGYLEKLTGNASNILSVYEQTISAKIAIARMMPIFWANNTSGNEGLVAYPNSWSEIKLINATFDYDNLGKSLKQVSLKNVNLKVRRGEHIGIVGATGSGKSTLSKIMIGLLPLTKGKYQIDDLDFYSIDHDSLSKNIALVLQDSEIFDLSLKENITLMRAESGSSLDLAIKVAHLDSVIKKLPNGLDTILGEKGYRLSGGERQRIGIARAIYRNPQLIIFDEATSSLDITTEKIIRENLDKLPGDNTTIWITHRTTTLDHCDRIYSISKGELELIGSYKDFLKNSENK
jgi:ABC-type multidrug transport system fused ATPase/permease subunit